MINYLLIFLFNFLPKRKHDAFRRCSYRRELSIHSIKQALYHYLHLIQQLLLDQFSHFIQVLQLSFHQFFISLPIIIINLMFIHHLTILIIIFTFPPLLVTSLIQFFFSLTPTQLLHLFYCLIMSIFSLLRNLLGLIFHYRLYLCFNGH